MGTMSRFVRKDARWQAGKSNPRATLADRVLSGLFLADVLAVISHHKQFNRKVRRLTFSLWKRHARNLPGYGRLSQVPGVGIADGKPGRINEVQRKLPEQPAKIAAIQRYAGVKLQLDNPGLVQQRMLARVR